jgi:hypothetical protein
MPAPGDYDGDGRAEAAIFRPSNGTWYIAATSTGTYTVGLGSNGDMPLVSTYVNYLNAVPPRVSLTNLTHPNLSPNFAVGDTYRMTISGAPNQPVTMVQTANGVTTTQAFGNTDSYGNLIVDYVEQTGNIGTYTQVWSVAGVQATPAVSFVVGQLGTSGTVTTTEIGQTADGHLEGVSSLSITNGVVSTYSATLLDYTASLYYDSNTVATLFDNSSAINQAITPITASTAAAMSANATAWHDYNVQTDHYAVAYFLSGGYFANPFYWGSSCYGDSGYCSIGSDGTYAYWITVASIYVGSTVAEQVQVPQDGSLPNFDLSVYNGFLDTQNPPPDRYAFFSNVTEWLRRMTTLYGAATLMDQANNPNKDFSIPPIPLFVKVQADCKAENGERIRQYTLMDIYGRPWNMDFPVAVHERFTDTINYSGSPPPPNGYWYNRVTPPPENAAQAVQIDKDSSTYLDHYRGELFGHYSFLQYYYATNFQLPEYMNPLSSQFSVDGVPGSVLMPLWILDSTGAALGAQSIEENGFNTFIQTTPMPSQTCPANWSVPGN